MDEILVPSHLDVQDDPFLSGRLSALYTFAVVSQYKSIRAAAQELFISPQALNKQISALEKKLGFPLIKRTSRGFTLTEYGEHVYRYATVLLQETQQLRRDLAAMHADNNHMLRLAYTADLYGTALHRHIMDFRTVVKSCKMRTVRHNFDRVMEIANGNEPFIAVTTRPVSTEGFDVTVLHNAKYFLLVHEDNPIAHAESVGLRELCGSTLTLYAEFFRANHYLLKHCTEERLSISTHLETGGLQAGIETCRRTKGALLVADYVQEQLAAAGLVKVAEADGLFSLDQVMMVRSDLEYSSMEKKFINYMKAYATAYGA